jgi:hypothetical protein
MLKEKGRKSAGDPMNGIGANLGSKSGADRFSAGRLVKV